jgi:hypothetical protein
MRLQGQIFSVQSCEKSTGKATKDRSNKLDIKGNPTLGKDKV